VSSQVIELAVGADGCVAAIAFEDVSGAQPDPAVAAFRDCRVLAESGAVFVGGDFAGHLERHRHAVRAVRLGHARGEHGFEQG
jgi:hypothetical protein